MTYVKFKDEIISKGFTDNKGVKGFVLKSGLFTLISSVTLAVFVGGIISSWLSLAVLIVSAIGFFFLLDYVAQDKEVFDSMSKRLKLWWVCLPAAVVLILLMKVFNFI